jgi:hypothetical protein
MNSAMGPIGFYEILRVVQIAFSGYVMFVVVRHGIDCLKGLYESVVVLKAILLFLSIGDLAVAVDHSQYHSMAEWGWLGFSGVLSAVIYRYMREQIRFRSMKRLGGHVRT